MNKSLVLDTKLNVNDQLRPSVWDIATSIPYEFGNERINKFAIDCILKNKKQYVKFVMNTVTQQAGAIFPGYHHSRYYDSPNPSFYLSFVKIVESIFTIFNLGHAYFVFAVELLVSIYLWFKQKTPPLIHICICSFVFCILFTTFIGTVGEYPRISIGVLPFMYLSLGLFLDWIGFTKT